MEPAKVSAREMGIILTATVVAAILLNKATGGKLITSIFKTATSATVGAATDAAAGVVQGVGQVVGIPATDAQKCQQAIANNDLWGVSLYCPAGTYLKALGDSMTNKGINGQGTAPAPAPTDNSIGGVATNTPPPVDTSQQPLYYEPSF